MSLLPLVLLGFAHAADATVASGGVAPDMNVQTFRPSTDSQAFFRLTDTAVAPAGTFGWRGTASYAKDLLVWTDFHGDETALVANLAQVDLAGGYSFGKARLAVNVPVVLRSFGGATDDATGLGDVTVDGKYRILDGKTGLSASARAFVPSSTLGAPLAGAFGGEVEIAVDRRLGDSLLVAGTVGTVLRDGQDMENVGWGSQLHVGLGAAYTVSDNLLALAEIDANGVLESLEQVEGRPSEALVGAQIGMGDIALRPAVGFGLGDAPGVPSVRALLAVTSVPKAKPVVLDTDGDGLADAADACPDKAEDVDTYLDTDGCPEPTEVTVKVVDSDGIAVTDAAWTSGTLSGKPGDTVKMEAGTATFTVGSVQKPTEIKAGAPTEVVLTIPAPRGALVVNIVDEAGKAVPNATWTCAGPTELKGQPAGTYAVRPGEYAVSAFAPGYKRTMVKKTIEKDGSLTVTLMMEPAKVEVSGSKIEIKGSIFFETNRAVILPGDSFKLLDEVADTLKDHPELTKVRVEGNTDSRGDNAANKTLSQGRAEAVVAYLTGKGVAATRLEAIGYGEEKPLVKETDEASRAKNRRVDFFVTERSDGGKMGDLKQIEVTGDKPKDK